MDLLDRPASEQLAALRAGRVARETLLEATLDRIAASTQNAVVSLRPRADILAETPPDGPLAGLPLAVKDLQDVAGIRTTHGHPAFADHVPDADAPLAARLRRAGATIIGKTNVPGFGLGSHTTNPVHGPTLNPWDPSRSAGGSSGGAGAALAARLVALADGSDMMGSLRNPAAWNGVYGLRPSLGMVPAGPAGDPVLHPLSTDGPMARTPADLALLLDVIAAPDPRLPAPPERPLPERATIAHTLDWDGAWPVEAGAAETFEAGLSHLSALGHRLVPYAPPVPAGRLWRAWTTLRAFAVAERMRPLWTDAFAAASTPALRWEVARGSALAAAEIHAASAVRGEWMAAFDAMEADLLATPAAQLMPFPVEWPHPDAVAGRVMDTYHRWMECTVPASLAGLPALALPAGLAGGLPNGLQLIGRRGTDRALLALAGPYERRLRWSERVPPTA